MRRLADQARPALGDDALHLRLPHQRCRPPEFEWAWQHPTESLVVRKAAAEFKSLGGIGNKVKLAYTMLNLLNLTVNFFSAKNTKFTAGCPALPCHMKTIVSPMEDLPCYVQGLSSEDDIMEPREDEEEPDAAVGGDASDHGLRTLDLGTGIVGEHHLDVPRARAARMLLED
ncbi:hypothetical protein ZWY2020_052983 [Hordeum vulgare]|nr:hypothetical protein ZWY2020_052983 [Hordeum vulgare]